MGRFGLAHSARPKRLSMRASCLVLLSAPLFMGCIAAFDERMLAENGCLPVSADPIAVGVTKGAMLGEAYAVASGIDEAIVFVAAEIVTTDEWGIWAIDDRPGASEVSRIRAVDDTAVAWSTWPSIDAYAVDAERGVQRAQACVTLARVVRANHDAQP